MWCKYFSSSLGNNAYLDHSSTSQMPLHILEVMQKYDTQYRANIGRGVYDWASKATSDYEQARVTIANCMGALSDEIVFTYGATDGLNMVSESLALQWVKTDQVILVSPLEHHANLLPWQRIAKKNNAKIMLLPLDRHYQIDYEQLSSMLKALPVAMIAVTHMSNVTGTVFDINRICALANQIPVVVDGTQATSHLSINVHDLGCAAYVWSAHKMYGPTGVGALYIASQYHDDIKPYRLGGGMITDVGYHTARYLPGARKLEAGTPPISSVMGFAKAHEFLSLEVDKMHAYELALMQKVKNVLKQYPVTLYSSESSVVCSFDYQEVHAHDVATILADNQVMVRSGHHCCMPFMSYLGVSALSRISLGCYNTQNNIDQLDVAMSKIAEILKL
ncbi:aminotransferase class V-fold PLP-dependent enzyme [Candidatus Comchoanobacter bicostacola]|uniref:Aminotransferase class V-fold PLP-dependent enzyme n=1 Tax=Candidatus Comchoanobacter bicostacola TaxID=2919598 RepID=A0ABY5DJ57_9GAMM|nr:aminotransferase class V-fold PLP-dependent enzyme [Candidatus Comchoanobacter bicostacola]UTC24374.1 aminotransferase class V-fold PLP-dependent enzyme [Candidatus Comchoanobacter bicostacola]